MSSIPAGRPRRRRVCRDRVGRAFAGRQSRPVERDEAAPAIIVEIREGLWPSGVAARPAKRRARRPEAAAPAAPRIPSGQAAKTDQRRRQSHRFRFFHVATSHRQGGEAETLLFSKPDRRRAHRRIARRAAEIVEILTMGETLEHRPPQIFLRGGAPKKEPRRRKTALTHRPFATGGVARAEDESAALEFRPGRRSKSLAYSAAVGSIQACPTNNNTPCRRRFGRGINPPERNNRIAREASQKRNPVSVTK